MSKLICQILLFVLASVSLFSCGTSKLKSNEKLYTGAKVEIQGDHLSKKERNELKDGILANVTPKPNTTILGLRPKVFINNLIGDVEKKKGLRHWIKQKAGEEPVLLREVDQEFNREIIVNYAENIGYFNARASYETIAKSKVAKVKYTVTPKKRYTIRNVTYEMDSTILGKEIMKLEDETFLKYEKPFELDKVKAERERIDRKLKENGFYFFNPDNLIVEADSTVTNSTEVDLTLRLKRNVPKLATKQFRIHKIIVFADYNIVDLKRKGYTIPYNTDSLTIYKNMWIVDPEERFKPKVFDNALQFNNGELYNRTDHNLSLNRLVSLGVFKFVKNEFYLSDSLNNYFDAYYVLTPNEMQSLRLETTASSNSADYVGSELNLNWTHRNLFRGAEQLRLALYGNFDKQIGGRGKSNNIYRIGFDAQLSIPRLIVPFKADTPGAYIPRTNAGIGYEYLNRTQQYALHHFNTSFGYLWKESSQKEHDLKLIEAALVYPESITEEYRDTMQNNPVLRRAVDDQLIYGPTYSYKYTNTMIPKKHTFYFRGTADLAGNLTGLILGANLKEGKQKTFFDVPFSQYAKIDYDFRYYNTFSKRSSLATRVIMGLAYPYGNSRYIPFSRQFFAGGTNSIRAFRARTLGPGSYYSDEGESLYNFDQGGDIRLELNAEYRFKVWKFIHAAAFVDAGNVWLVNKDEDRPGGKISKDWYKEIAIGAGLGVRLDFSILILRLDLSSPVRTPYLAEGERWTYDKVDFFDKNWRKDNLIFNIAIGYPF